MAECRALPAYLTSAERNLDNLTSPARQSPQKGPPSDRRQGGSVRSTNRAGVRASPFGAGPSLGSSQLSHWTDMEAAVSHGQ